MQSTPIAPTGAATAMPMTNVRAKSASEVDTATAGSAGASGRSSGVDSTTVVRVRAMPGSALRPSLTNSSSPRVPATWTLRR